jgi:hypothetical protein
MKKTLAAVLAGTLLVASQAAAQSTAAPRVADRLGATAGESSELMGAPAGLIFLGVTGAAAAIFSAATDDDSESD